MSKTLIERLQKSFEWLWQRSLVVSNLGKPKSDNEYGRAATLMTEVVTEIKRLEAAIYTIKITSLTCINNHDAKDHKRIRRTIIDLAEAALAAQSENKEGEDAN